MKIIYIHGFNSSGNGGTATKLKAVYDVISPDYNYINADEGYSKLNKVILENIHQDSEIVIVGSSLGGFWANYFAQKYDVKCVLINPSLNPTKSLLKYIGSNKNFVTNEVFNLTQKDVNTYKKYQISINKKTFRTTLIGQKDTVVDTQETLNLLKNTVIKFNKEEGHQFKNIMDITKAIDESVNTFVEDILSDAQYITETVVNIFDNNLKQKLKYIDEVWDLLQKSYAKIGGIHGNGFSSKEDMIKNIPFWKLVTKNGKVICVAMYKDKNGRKRVAVGTDGSSEGKQAFLMLAKEDINQQRSYGEFSGPSLDFQIKNLTNIEKNIVPISVVKEILKDEDIKPAHPDSPEVLKYPHLKPYFYQRKIGNQWHTKIMLGTPFKQITI